MSKILIDRSVVEQALEALEAWKDDAPSHWTASDEEAITSLRAALEQQEPEPVARVIEDGTPEGSTEWIPYSMRQATIKTGDLLYTHSPREWVGLTDEEMVDLQDRCGVTILREDFAAIEAKLKEKNTHD